MDFFLDRRPTGRLRAKVGNRLLATDYVPWTSESLEEYLKGNCGLRPDNRIVGQVVVEHHEVYDVWKKLIEESKLITPFHVTHVDSHADFGLGDTSPLYIMCELLQLDLKNRQDPRRGYPDGLSEGNFLAFALACRWLSSIDYVLHPDTTRDNIGIHDIPPSIFKNNDHACGILQLKKYHQSARQAGRLNFCTPLEFEPEVPIRLIASDSLKSESYDFIFVARSPRYTPESSDELIEVIEHFIEPI